MILRKELLVFAFALSACAVSSPPTTRSTTPEGQMPAEASQSQSSDEAARYTLLVADPARSAEDRALDGQRKPEALLAFAGIASGMKVAELGAGGGYTAELLARAVGPSGHVYGHNSAFILQRFAEAPWSARLATPAMANVTRMDRPFDDPFAPAARQLDAVLIVFFYHDTVWQGIDRARMNRAVFDALRPGGVYIILDHSAAAGHGVADVETLHRIEESVVRDEVLAAGFQLAAQASTWRNPEDTRDWSASPRVAGERRGTSDRFALKFVKP